MNHSEPYIGVISIEQEEAVFTSQRLSEVLPMPITWCEIPAGEVTMTDLKGYLDRARKYAVDAFAIAKHPVTCGQYAHFMADGGYDRRELWTDAGWEWREEDEQTQPDFWWNDYFNQPQRPVVGVSFYEALAFCNWLNQVADTDGITLPTEQQWQRAAQSEDDRPYPWGDEFDSGRCNTKESGIVTTTDIGNYPSGESPYGVADMSGNVWEWCITEWASGTNTGKGDETRVIRGGSWFDAGNTARVSVRRDSVPFMRFSYYGFRCCVAV